MRGHGRSHLADSLAIGALLPWMVLACANKDAVLGVAPTVHGTTSLSLDVQPIFSASCASAFCHGSPLGAPMSLLPSDAFNSLVGVASCEAPSLQRVNAGHSAASYLLVKIEGTQSVIQSAGGCATCTFPAGSTGNCGARMPLGGPPYLSDAEIQLIRDWVDEGAADN
jgi:hypothetical protein